MTARTPRGCVLRALTLYGGFVVGVWLLWLLLGHITGWWMGRREQQAWAATGTSLEAMRARFPRQSASSAAVELDRAARPLGLRLIADPAVPSQIEDKALYDVMSKALGRLSKGGDEGYEPPPPEVRAFLDRQRAQLAYVARHLNGAADITWETDLDRGPEGPIPSLLAHRYLNTMLLTEALERHRRGDDAGAGEMLDAAWHQSESLASRPEIISQLITIALAFQQGDVLRRVGGGTAPWDTRLRPRHHKAIVETFRTEAYMWVVMNQTYRGAADLEVREPPPVGPGGWLLRVTTAPYVQMGFSGISYHLRRGRELALANDPCRMNGDELDKAVSDGIPRWDVIARLAVPSMMRAVTSGATADLDNELTRVVLKTRRGEAGGTPPFSLKSDVCQDVVWRHERGGDGRWTIKADPGPGTLDPKRLKRWDFTVSSVARRR